MYLLDLDRTGLAEPAMDLGKFLADLRWWGTTTGLTFGLIRASSGGTGRATRPGSPVRA